MKDNPTVVRLFPIVVSTATSTQGASPDKKLEEEDDPKPPKFPTPDPTGPSDIVYKIILSLLVVFIIGWLTWLTIEFYRESKEIANKIYNVQNVLTDKINTNQIVLTNKINDNQEELIKLMSFYQIGLKDQISEFEHRNEVYMRDLQKMILQSQNNNSK